MNQEELWSCVFMCVAIFYLSFHVGLLRKDIKNALDEIEKMKQTKGT